MMSDLKAVSAGWHNGLSGVKASVIRKYLEYYSTSESAGDR